jgi:hypothetical protein
MRDAACNAKAGSETIAVAPCPEGLPMNPAAHLILVLTGLAVATTAPAAPPPAPVEGLYVADIMETATALQLTADGRWEWRFSVGALDMEAAGRWTLEADGSLLLNSDPPVVAPRFDLIGRTKSADPGVLVRVADESDSAPAWLGAVAEYRDGGTSGGHFEGGEHYFEPDPARPIAAIRIASFFGITSERHPVEPGDVLSFRFHPNDLGIADFRDVRVSAEGDALTFVWQGTSLRYVRERARRARAAPPADPAPPSGAEAAAEAAAEAVADAVESGGPYPADDGMDYTAAEDELTARRTPPPPFRPGERIEIVNGSWPERHGAIGDVRYSYLVDHRGFVLKAAVDGPAADKGGEPAQGEPGDMADDPDSWDLAADRGGMEEGDRWSIVHEKTGLWLKMSPDGHVAEICLASVEYQDRAHRIRVGNNAPIRVSSQDCNKQDGALLEGQLRTGGPLVMSASIWTNPVSADRTGDAGHFGLVMDLFDHLRAAGPEPPAQ